VSVTTKDLAVNVGIVAYGAQESTPALVELKT